MLLHIHSEEDSGEFICTTIEPEIKSKKSQKIDADAYARLLSVIIEMVGKPDKIGIRIVAPGTYFNHHRLIDDEYISFLKKSALIAPLHIQNVLLEIERIRKEIPNVPIYGISDSSFHRRLPMYAKRYAIAKKDTEDFDVYRFGYHGLSIISVLRKLPKMPSRIIVCHLGGGSSISAIKDGTSVETSMGFTPLEGVVMSTRGGNIDDGVLLYLARKKQMSFTELRAYLFNNSGLLGVSNISSSVKELLDAEVSGKEGATLALDMLAHSVKKYIGAYTAELNGLDMIIFTGTIGERSAPMRERICRNLGNLGIRLNLRKNKKTDSVFSYIQSFRSKVKIVVIPTDEMGEMARIIKEV
jgi:acetate kinase